MTSFLDAGLHGVRNLHRFAGRDSRSQFWFYILWLVIAQQLLSIVGMGVVLVSIDFGGSLNPGGTDADMSAVSAGHFRVFATVAAIIFGSIVAFLALVLAAVARRLHDSDLRGWWGLIPVPCLLFGFVGMAVFWTSMDQPSLRLFSAIFINNLVYLILIGVLIVLLCRPSTIGPNRFGDRPV